MIFGQKVAFKKFRVNATGDWGYFNIWSEDASQYRLRNYEEECRQFIEDAIREKIQRDSSGN